MPLVRQPRVARLAFLVFLAARPLVDSFLLSPSLLPLSNKGLRRSPADQQHEVGVKVTPQVTGRKHHGTPTPLHQKLQLPPPLLEVEVVEEADEEEEALSAGEGKLVNRRAYFEQLLYKTVATVAVSGASSLIAPPRRCLAGGLGYEEPGSRWQPEGNPKQAASWFPLLKKCYESLEDVLANWEKYTVRQDGDAIRRLIGTIGVSSPLSSLRKAFTSIRDAEEESQGDIDVIEYVEAYMEVLTALGDAENDLYSANFADYSGGGGTKGSQFITKAQKSLKIARDDFKVVNKILGI